MNEFLSTLKDEVSETKDVREKISVEKQKAEIEYKQMIERAHDSMGNTIPCRTSSTARSRERSVPEPEPEPEALGHVTFDESTFLPPPPPPKRKPTVPRDIVRVKKKNYILDLQE